MIKLHKYFSIVKQKFNNNGLIQEHPDKPFKVVKNREGQITGISTFRFRIRFSDGNSLDYSEIGDIESGTDIFYKINSHSYHFNAQIRDYHPFRIDLDGHGCHANDYDDNKVKFNSNWPDHLKYPTDIDLKIEDYNLALAIESSLLYLSTQKYPLENVNAALYNESNDRVRRQLSE